MLRLEGTNGVLPKNPFVIRMSVESSAKRKIEGAFPKKRGDFSSLKVRNKTQGNNLLNLTQLIDGTMVKVSLHPTLNITRYVVSCVDVIDLSDEDLKQHLKDQKVIEVRRITRKEGDRKINTPTMVLTINGTVAPEFIEFGWIRASTRPYYPAPMQCFQC